MQQKTSSSEETIKLGKKIASQFAGGDVVLLHGDLGAGKTTLVKGIAEYFGIEPNDVVSPTFTLMQVYKVESKKYKVKSLVHIDTYRLESEEQLIEIGVEDYLGDEDTVCLIEWPEKLNTLLKNKKTLNINIEHRNMDERMVTFNF
jgi:tRNA threonylcarbamoyladenosine biosynthesis protein TsaE